MDMAGAENTLRHVKSPESVLIHAHIDQNITIFWFQMRLRQDRYRRSLRYV